jgi:AraC family transcriptional regulator, regulatory protein of adaptative response / DNA-3-methyladenine glycosylase II
MQGGNPSSVTVRMRYAAPYDWPAILGFLEARAVDGVERVEDGRYARTFVETGRVGIVEVVHSPADDSLATTVRPDPEGGVPATMTRIARVFDLGANVSAIGAHLACDPFLAPLIAARPGLRVPGGWDGFELAVRAVLGQQVSVEAGRRLAGELVQVCGAMVPVERAGHAGLTRVFPTAEQVARADLTGLGMPNARRQALVAVAQAALADPGIFQAGGTLDQTVARLRAIRGVGDWTAQYIALRAAREPDAFPASDVGLLRACVRPDGTRPSPLDLAARAERWRPWRAYAAQHLWAADAATARRAVGSHPAGVALSPATRSI